jgi:hypothetical protein
MTAAEGKSRTEVGKMKRALFAALSIGLLIPTSAQAADTVSMKAKITSFAATRDGVVANGIMTGALRSGGEVARDTSKIKLQVSQRRNRRRCDILTLNLQQLHLDLLGARVQTSAINLELYGRRSAILGRLFCALARARISFPRAAAALNRKLDGRPLRVMATRTDVPRQTTDHQGTCQVLRLVLGPLHLDLLGLNVDLYGRNKRSPVTVTIVALPGHGLLGDVLCSLAGGANITSLAALQNVLRGLGVSVADAALQNVLNGLGLGDLSGGLSQVDLQRILAALGVTTPAVTSST